MTRKMPAPPMLKPEDLMLLNPEERREAENQDELRRAGILRAAAYRQAAMLAEAAAQETRNQQATAKLTRWVLLVEQRKQTKTAN